MAIIGDLPPLTLITVYFLQGQADGEAFASCHLTALLWRSEGASSSSGLEYISLVTRDINLWDLLLWARSHLSVFNSPEKLREYEVD